MEMSAAYAEETADALEQRGYSLHVVRSKVSGDHASYRSTQYQLKATERHLVLEVVEQDEAEPRYFLEIAEHHGLRTASLELDSWKHREGSIEFRYVTHPQTGGAVTFILDHPTTSH